MVALEAVEGGHGRRRGQLGRRRSGPRRGGRPGRGRPPRCPRRRPGPRRRAAARARCRRPGLARRARPRRRSACSPGWSTAWPRSSTARSATTASPRHDSRPSGWAPPPGVRRRWVQPTGSIELNVKTPELDGSAWTGISTADFTDVDVVALAAEATARLGWGARRVSAAGRSLRDAAAAVGGVGLPAACWRGRWAVGRPRRGAVPSPVRTGPRGRAATDRLPLTLA